MVATVVIVDSDVALYTDPFGGTEAEDTVLDDRNGIECCCGGLLPCAACCGDARCCYAFGQVEEDEITGLFLEFGWNLYTGGNLVDFGYMKMEQVGLSTLKMLFTCKAEIVAKVEWRTARKGSCSTIATIIQQQLGLRQHNTGFLWAQPGIKIDAPCFDSLNMPSVDQLAWESRPGNTEDCDGINAQWVFIDNNPPIGDRKETSVTYSLAVVRKIRPCLNNCTVCPP